MSAFRLHGIPVLFLLLLTAACGGSSGSGSPTSLVALQAPVHQDGEGYVTAGFGANGGAPLTAVGDNSLDQSFAGIFCFDLTGIGTVDSAVLRLHFAYEVGDPWSLGELRLDHIDGGGMLDLSDYDGGTLTADVFTLAKQDEYVLDVTDLVAADVAAGRSYSTFRLRFEVPTNSDAMSDFARFGSSQAADPADWPTLEVTHVAP